MSQGTREGGNRLLTFEHTARDGEALFLGYFSSPSDLPLKVHSRATGSTNSRGPADPT
jgi:hypothetical protein